MSKIGKQINQEEKSFHDKWASTIKLDDLCILEAFEGPVSPEYHAAIKLLGDLNGKQILNPGCGAGEEAIYLAQQGAKVTAVDISTGMIEVSKKLVSKFKLNRKIKVKQMNAEKLEFDNQTFDLIFGNSVLHHVDMEKALKEMRRVLKKKGQVVFIEPLAYNPIINLYRRMANIVRTPHEHPLTFKDLKTFEKHFKNVKHFEYQFSTLLIFCMFYLLERVHPNKDRYWKKIIREGEKYHSVFKILYTIDQIILTLIPYLRRFCWVIVVRAEK